MSGAIGQTEGNLYGRDLAPLASDHARRFTEHFGPGSAPRVFFSPGRVNLIGAHLDYNGGPVMPTAIDRGTFLAVRPRSDRRIFLASTSDPTPFEFELGDLPAGRVGNWVDYPLGVLIDLYESARANGRSERPEGMEILFGGNLPVGAGLSSSASICVGTAYALDQTWQLQLQTLERVRSALRAEREFVGVQCGIMDPYAVGLARPGHLLWLDCKDESWEHIPIDFDRVSICVADTGVRRELATGAFNRRVEQCESAFEALKGYVPGAACLRDVPAEVLRDHEHELDEEARKRARHVIDEVQRAFGAREALLRGDIAAMGASMLVSHESLREQYEVSCPELDVLVDACADVEGGLGGRLTGAGFGGCAVLLVERGAEERVATFVQDRFAARFHRRPAIEFFGGDVGPRELDV